MAVWPFLMGLSGLVLAMALISGRKRYSFAAFAIFASYCTVRLFVSVGVPSPSTIYALIWIFAASAIFAHSRENYGISTMLAASALCYLWAKAAGASAAFGVLPFVLSDLFALAAMLFIGGGVYRDFIGRISDLVRGRAGRRFDNLRGRGMLHQEATSEKAR